MFDKLMINIHKKIVYKSFSHKRQLVLSFSCTDPYILLLLFLLSTRYLNEVLSVNLSTRCQGVDDMTGDEMIITVLLW